jgi:hypothetical protein
MPAEPQTSAQRGRVRTHARPERAAVLIVALILAALIAVGLGSYLNLNLSSSKLARRTFHGYAALNLAEAGVEEAMWSFNRAGSGDSEAWKDWQTNGPAAWKKFSGFELGNNASGWVKVFVDNHSPGPSARPKVITQSSVGTPGDLSVTRMLELTLRRRSLFANGIVAKESVVFNGAVASVDSWHSDPDGDPDTAPVAYSPAVRRDRGTVASADVYNSALIVNQANIWGFVATGGAQPQVGTNGTIRGADTPPAVKLDSRRIATDFNADFPSVSAPVDGIVLGAVPTTLGIAGTKTKYRVAAIVLTGRQTLTILGDVTLILTGTGMDALSLSGTSSLIIAKGAKLTIYIEGDMKVAGKGIANANIQPASCLIFGVNRRAGGQVLEVTGNGALKCAIYAPNAEVRINGNGDIMGSIIGQKVTLNGDADFHYDEALAGGEGEEPFTIAKWRELNSATDRARYEAVFRDW